MFQENALFAGTLEDNLRLAKPDASELELRRAAQLAGADEFVRALPDGWQTRLGRGGAGLSVGQKQRIAIARALLRDAPILILDEPTSALDPDTEKRLLGTLAEAARDRIVLLVSHRLSTVRSADQILFLRDGRDRRARHARGAVRDPGRRVPPLRRTAGQRLSGLDAAKPRHPRFARLRLAARAFRRLRTRLGAALASPR